jgi:hypothetical protein
VSIDHNLQIDELRRVAMSVDDQKRQPVLA